MSKFKKMIVGLCVLAILIAVSSFAMADYLGVGRGDPFELMYDSDALFEEKIDELAPLIVQDMLFEEARLEEAQVDISVPEITEAKNILSTEASVKGMAEEFSPVSNQELAREKEQEIQSLFDNEIKLEIKKAYDKGNLEKVEELEISEMAKSMVKDAMEEVKEDRFIVKYRSSSRDIKSMLEPRIADAQRVGDTEILVLAEKVNPKELADSLKDQGAGREIEYIQPDFKMYYAAEEITLELVFDEKKPLDTEADPEENIEDQESEKITSEDENQEDNPRDPEVEENKDIETEANQEEKEAENPAIDLENREPILTEDQLEALAKNSSEIIVAVIDTGIDINHSGLKDHIWVNPEDETIRGWNFYANNSQVTTVDNPSSDSHGTHIAGIIVNMALNRQDYLAKIEEDQNSAELPEENLENEEEIPADIEEGKDEEESDLPNNETQKDLGENLPDEQTSTESDEEPGNPMEEIMSFSFQKQVSKMVVDVLEDKLKKSEEDAEALTPNDDDSLKDENREDSAENQEDLDKNPENNPEENDEDAKAPEETEDVEKQSQEGFDIKIMPLKVFGENGAYTSDIILAIEYAEANGAKIANCSFGSTEYNRALEEAIANSNMLFVSSVGNARTDLEETPIYPACYDLPNMVSVASLNNDGGFSYYSNYSESKVDLAATGRDVYSTLPNEEYGPMSGTSMSAAEVSGAAAVILSALGQEEALHAPALKERLIQTGDMLNHLDQKVKDGRRLNIEQSLLGEPQTEWMSIYHEDDFDVHGYQPTQGEQYRLFSSGGEIVQVAAGTEHTIVLKENGTVWAWGRNNYGQCGTGSTSYSESLTQVTGLADVTYIETDGSSNLAVKSNGTVWAWGYNSYGQLGDGTTTNRTAPVQVSGLTGVVAVAASGSHSLALKSNGTVWAWGYNNYGQLGDGTTTNRSIPVQVSGLTGVVSVAVGYNHSLALKTDGTVWAWGYNNYGQLGNGTTTNRTTPVQVSGLTGVVSVAAGGFHSLVLKTNGTVWAWGYNYYGQLGDGTTTNRSTPVQVSGLTGVASIAAGAYHCLAVKTDGTVWAWGYNNYGQLGDGTTTKRSTSVQVSGLTGAVSVAASYGHNLAVKTDGTVWAWGYNTYGQLGDGTIGGSPTPLQVSGLTGVVSVVAGGGHSLALKTDGTVWAWGHNNCGQLGDGTTTNRSTPVQVSGLTGVVSVAANYRHSLAVKADGTVWAWGYNYYGQLGDGTTTNRNTPVQVSGLTGVVAVAAGGSHSLALKSNGMVWAWGDNFYGQLGDGTTIKRTTPVQSRLGGVSVAAGSAHSLAARGDGTVWACGNNEDSQLGDANDQDQSTPIDVMKLTGAVSVAAGGNYSLALKTDGTVEEWGDNKYGRPGSVGWLTGAVSVATSGSHSLALKNNGTVWAWGSNSYGQLGDGTVTVRNAPVQVSGLTGMVSVATGGGYSLAVKSNGTVWAWGHNQDSALSFPYLEFSTTPIQVSFTKDLSLSFSQEDYTVLIPGEENNLVNMYAYVLDKEGNHISAEIAYSLDQPYNGVSIDGNSGLVTVSPEALPGQVQVNARFGQITATAILNIMPGEGVQSSITISVVQGNTYYINTKAKGISTFENEQFTFSYNPSVLQLVDLCSVTYEKEMSIGTISKGKITVNTLSNGVIDFTSDKVVPDGLTWSGVVNVFSFEAVASGNTTITLVSGE